MKAEISIELEAEDLKDKKLSAYVMKLLAKAIVILLVLIDHFL